MKKQLKRMKSKRFKFSNRNSILDKKKRNFLKDKIL